MVAIVQLAGEDWTIATHDTPPERLADMGQVRCRCSNHFYDPDLCRMYTEPRTKSPAL